MTKLSHSAPSRLTFFFLIFVTITTLPCELQAQDLSLDDIISGLEAFESRFSEMACNYTIEVERSDLHKKLRPDRTWERKVSSYDLLLERDRRVASIHYRMEGGERHPEYKVAFDGDKVQGIQYLGAEYQESPRPRTAVGTANAWMNREDAIPSDGPFTMFAQFTRRASWSEFLRDGPPAGELKECALVRVLQQEDDIECVVRLRFSESHVYYVETITLNASKGFWPVHILLEVEGFDLEGLEGVGLEGIESVDLEEGEEFAKSVVSELTVHGLKSVSDFAIPTSIQKKEYAVPFPWAKFLGLADLAPAERVLEEAVYEYHLVDFEPSFFDDAFKIEYPPNSLYRDASTDETYRVDGSGNTERVLAVPPGKYANEEEFERLREQRLGNKQGNTLRYMLTFLGIAVLVAALITWYRRGTR
jgi:hypothetical protein